MHNTIKDTMKYKHGYVDVNGLNLYYEIYGEGQPLVLIHGGGSTIQTSFGRIIPGLSKHRQVIAVELQSHGHTPDIDRPETFEQDADDVAALVKHLQIERADYFGFSNGGNTAMQVAIRHPELVRKMVLASAFYKRAGMQPWFFGSLQDATLNDMPAQLKAAYAAVAPDPGNLPKMFSKDKQRMVEFRDWKAEDIQSITAPALLIAGDQDVVLPEHAVDMFRLLPHAQLAILPGAHGEYIGEITTKQDSTFISATASLINRFLDEPMPTVK